MRPLIPPPIQGLLAALLIWALDRLSPLPDWEGVVPSALGYAFMGLGLVIEGIAVAGFIRAKTTVNPLAPEKASRLVTGGLYRMTRNPMYVGLAVLLTGWALSLGEPLCAGVVALFVLILTETQIKPEERALSAKFGAAYDDYRARVGRWL